MLRWAAVTRRGCGGQSGRGNGRVSRTVVYETATSSAPTWHGRGRLCRHFYSRTKMTRARCDQRTDGRQRARPVVPRRRGHSRRLARSRPIRTAAFIVGTKCRVHRRAGRVTDK